MSCIAVVSIFGIYILLGIISFSKVRDNDKKDKRNQNIFNLLRNDARGGLTDVVNTSTTVVAYLTQNSTL
jgi:type II secretory pathway pseudopilin PulG